MPSISGTSACAIATLVPPLRGQHELGAPVRRVGHPGDVAVILEVSDELGHGLLGHLRAFGEEADRRARVVQILEDGAVRRAYRGVAPLGEGGEDEIIERHEGLA